MEESTVKIQTSTSPTPKKRERWQKDIAYQMKIFQPKSRISYNKAEERKDHIAYNKAEERKRKDHSNTGVGDSMLQAA